MKMKIMRGLALSAAIYSAGLAGADVIIKYIDADSEIRSSADANKDYGTSDQVLIRYQADVNGTTTAIKGYFKVNLDSLLSEGEMFGNSSLSLKAAGNTNRGTTFSLYGIVNNNDSWSEAGITWNNAPEHDTSSANGVSAGTALLATVTVGTGEFNSGTTYTFSDPRIAEYLNWTAGTISDPYGNGASGDAFATFILVSEPVLDGTLYRFHSIDAAGTSNDPYISYTVIPEPVTLGLFTVAGGGLLLLRRLL